jgi:metal-sulfur cluster biosynthetic enzyme
MFIQTETMPEPSKLRFLPGREVLPSGTLDLGNRRDAAASPLAERLFAIPGIAGVSLDRDGITVTREDGDWRHLKPAILGAIMEHFLSGAPIVRSEAAPSRRPVGAASAGEAQAVDRIREALRQVIDPELGYNILDLGLVYDVALGDGGVVTIVMTTTTPGCPATSYLKAGAGEAAAAVAGVEFVDVKLTYEPRWTPEMMTEAAKGHFGIGDGDGGW